MFSTTSTSLGRFTISGFSSLMEVMKMVNTTVDVRLGLPKSFTSTWSWNRRSRTAEGKMRVKSVSQLLKRKKKRKKNGSAVSTNYTQGRGKVRTIIWCYANDSLHAIFMVLYYCITQRGIVLFSLLFAVLEDENNELNTQWRKSQSLFSCSCRIKLRYAEQHSCKTNHKGKTLQYAAGSY